MKWAVGVMAAPRKDLQGLENCLSAMEGAGWNPMVFAEPGVPNAVADRCETIFRPNVCRLHPDLVPSTEGKFGNVQNWVQTAADLLEIDEDADAYVTVEDDAVVCRNARHFIERLIWPSDTCGAISLYAANISSCRKPYPQMFLHRRNGIIGTLLMIWRPQCLREMISSDGVQTILAGSQVPPWQIKGVDTWIGNELNRRKWDLWTVSPSLVQHWHPFGRSAYSSLGHGPAVGKRQAYKFVGMDADLNNIFSAYLRQVNK